MTNMDPTVEKLLRDFVQRVTLTQSSRHAVSGGAHTGSSEGWRSCYAPHCLEAAALVDRAMAILPTDEPPNWTVIKVLPADGRVTPANTLVFQRLGEPDEELQQRRWFRPGNEGGWAWRDVTELGKVEVVWTPVATG